MFTAPWLRPKDRHLGRTNFDAHTPVEMPWCSFFLSLSLSVPSWLSHTCNARMFQIFHAHVGWLEARDLAWPTDPHLQRLARSMHCARRRSLDPRRHDYFITNTYICVVMPICCASLVIAHVRSVFPFCLLVSKPLKGCN